MLEKLLLYDNQQPRPLIMLRNILMVRLIDYPKGVLAVMLGNGDKLFNEFIGSKSAYSNVHKVLTGKLIYINLMDIIGNILNSLRYSQVCDESRNVYARFYL